MDEKITCLTFSGSTSHNEICRAFGIDPNDMNARIHGQITVEYWLSDDRPEKDPVAHADFGRPFSTEWSPIGLWAALHFLLQVKQPVVKRVRFLTQMPVGSDFYGRARCTACTETHDTDARHAHCDGCVCTSCVEDREAHRVDDAPAPDLSDLDAYKPYL